MSGGQTGMKSRSICQIVDANGKPAEATATSMLWETNPNVFAGKTDGNKMQAFTTGKDYFTDLLAEFEKANQKIYIAGWGVAWDAMLSPKVRLYDAIRAAAARGVNVYIMPWLHNNPVQTYDYQTVTVLDAINDALKLTGANRRVYTVRSASRAKRNQGYFSHHQKLVVVDDKIAYLGGMDLYYGRYDTADFDLHANASERQVLNRYNPCIPAQQVLPEAAKTLANPDLLTGAVDEQINRSSELKKIEQGAWQIPYAAPTEGAVAGKWNMIGKSGAGDSNTPDLTTLNPVTQPRMPWQDVHSRIEGPAVSDIARNFVERWNMTGPLKRLPLPPAPSSQPKAGTLSLQVLRSAPAGMRPSATPFSTLSNSTLNRELSVGSLKTAPVADEDHIYKRMQKLIERSHHFIYIEMQFFVSNFGAQVPAPGEVLSPAAQYINSYGGKNQNATAKHVVQPLYQKNGNQDSLHPPENTLVQDLISRIRLAILSGRPYHVYLTMPVHPEGILTSANVAVQVYWTMQTIAHGSHSLLNGIRRAFKERELIKGGMNHLAANVAAYKLPTEELDQEDERWKDYVTLLNLRNWQDLGKGRVVTEQIYVHTKLMIVDDLYVILGSANINDRSLLGSRDSEIAVLVMDQDNTVKQLCDSGKNHAVRVFAHELRKDIWKKLFGITGGVRPASHLASAIEAPASPKSWKAIQKQAEDNAKAYEAAFPFVPRNWFGGEKDKPEPAKIIPNWQNGATNPKTGEKTGYPTSPNPFDTTFWSAPQHNPAAVSGLNSIKGFITALPVHWLQAENVRFAFPTDLVAKNEATKSPTKQPNIQTASNAPAQENKV